MASLLNKVVIITGANSGIGAATALAFAKTGARLVLAARNQERLNDVANQCSAKGLPQEKVLVKRCDVTNEENLKGLVGSAIDKYGQIDILVNNAGSAQYVNYLETTTEVFDTTFNLNIRAPFFLTKLCTTHLKKTKGCVVNVSSLAGQRSFPIAMVYGMTKAAMDQFTRTLAVDLVKDSVRVNSVNPGVIDSLEFQAWCKMRRMESPQNSKMEGQRVQGVEPLVFAETPSSAFYTKPEFQRRAGMTEEFYNQYIEKQKELQPLTGAVEPEEVAKVILFLASDQSSSITGELIYVDGGRHAIMPL